MAIKFCDWYVCIKIKESTILYLLLRQLLVAMFFLMANLCKHIKFYICIGDEELDMDIFGMKICFSLCSIMEEALVVPKEKSRSAFK